ncbi:MAG: hypothetical protein H0T15_06955 [Thermoleophilaceae bacterium]|nr:hypothetical protein [Thermoleophilaceae bacterium]
MFLLGVSSDEKVLWQIVLGMGLVVILVVIALLTLLQRLVRDIDQGVHSLWTVTQRVAQNTTGLYQLAGTGSVLRALREEMIRHDKLLSEEDQR